MSFGNNIWFLGINPPSLEHVFINNMYLIHVNLLAQGAPARWIGEDYKVLQGGADAAAYPSFRLTSATYLFD